MTINKNNQAAVPALRFKEFEESLQQIKLGETAIFFKGKGISKSDIVENGKIECIRYGELYTHYGEVIEVIKSRINLSKDELVFSKENDVIIPASGESQIDIATASCVKKDNIALSGDLNIIRTKHDGIFLAYYLNNEKKFAIAKLAQGSSVVHLYSKQLKTLKLNLPTLPEQQKIATFLTAVDRKIQQLREKQALLQQYKKGVMQRIFSQEIRFKRADGTDFGEWEEKRLGEVFSFIRNNSFSRNYLNYEKGEVKNIHYGDIHTKFSSNFKIEDEEVPHINQDISLDKIKAEDFCKEGDVVVADASEDYNDIGKSIEIIHLNNEKLLAGLHTHLLRSKKKAAIGFYGYLFQSRLVRLQIMKLATGVSVLGISKTNLGKIILQIPSHEEQQKIATFLTQLDAKIEGVAAQLAEVEAFKKGLLQQMFV